MKPIVKSSWGLTSEFDYRKQITIKVDHLIKEKTAGIDIILVVEPVRPKLINELMNLSTLKYYDIVLTHNEQLLKVNPKTIFHNQHPTWIRDYGFPDKKFGVSTIISGRNPDLKEGVKMRIELWDKQDAIRIPKMFYNSSKLPYVTDRKNLNLGRVNTDKAQLFDTMFHVCIECTSVNWYFSEKLLDCFQTMTVPVYYGCIDIGRYFNTNGIIQCRSADEIIQVCNDLTEEDYLSRIMPMKENYILAQKYLTHTQILDDKLKQLCV